MVARVVKNKKPARKRVPALKSKKVDWDKYVGKIKFPKATLAYLQVLRNEWQ
jgi:hypothetical protein